MSGGGSKQTNEQKNTIDPELKALEMQNFNRASTIADTPFQAYTGERVAGFNPTQLAGQQGLIAAATDPSSGAALSRAKTSIGSLLDFAPRMVTAPTIDVGQLKNTDLAPYLNPFINDVVDTSLSDLAHARDVQGVKDNASATAAHAFGGTRQAVQNANTTDDYLRNVASTSSNLRSAGYDRAVGAAQTDIGNRFSRDQFNASNAFDASRTNSSNDMAGANLRLNAGSQYANLSDQELSQGLQRAGVLEGVGAEQQQNQQQVDDASYQEFMRELAYPMQQQNIRNAALGMIPIEQTTTGSSATSNTPSTASMIGTGLSAASMF